MDMAMTHCEDKRWQQIRYRKRVRRALHERGKYTFAEWLEWAAAASALWLVRCCPWRASALLGEVWGELVWLLAPARRRIALQGLSIALGGERSVREIRSLARSAAKNFARARMAFVRLSDRRQNELCRVTRIHGLEHLVSARRDEKGVLLVTIHLGYWELIGARLVAEGFPITVISRPRSNPLVDRLWRNIENGSGMQVLSKFQSVRQVMRALNQGRIVGILPDQHAGRAGIFIDFFGRPTPMHPVVPLVSLRTGAPVVPCIAPLEADGLVHIRLFPPLNLVRSDDPKRDVKENTTLLTRIFESFIRSYPEQYLWMHHRWRDSDLERYRQLVREAEEMPAVRTEGDGE